MAWHLIQTSIYRRLRAERELRPECDRPEGEVLGIFAVGDPADVSTWGKRLSSKNVGSLQDYAYLLVDGLTVRDAQALRAEEMEDGPDPTDPYVVLRTCARVVDPVALAARLTADGQTLHARRVEDTFAKDTAPLPMAFPRVTRAQLMETVRDRKTDPLSDLVRDAQLRDHPVQPRPARPTQAEIDARPTPTPPTAEEVAAREAQKQREILRMLEARAAQLRAEGVTPATEVSR